MACSMVYSKILLMNVNKRWFIDAMDNGASYDFLTCVALLASKNSAERTILFSFCTGSGPLRADVHPADSERDSGG